jgi:hypothetical protein
MMTIPDPTAEHQWLQRLVGNWTYEGECPGEADQPPMKSGGMERVRSIGALWIVADGQGEMPGGAPATMMMSLGYDPQQQRFVGTWLGSMMTHLWVYRGSLDADRRVLTLEAEGPSMAGDGTTANYRDVIELESDDRRTLRSYVQGADGNWTHFATMQYRRVN